MKKLVFISLLLPCFSFGQNLVPNPSFEDYSPCPTSQCQIHRAVGWSSFSYSPDYFNSCNTGGFSVPNNSVGFQYAATGDAYAGLYTYADLDGREYIGSQLSAPLIIGEKYYASLKVSRGESMGLHLAINKLGLLFSTVSYHLDSIPACSGSISSLLATNSAHIYTDSVITDTTDWVTISGTFIADSAYQYVIIGNHFDNSNTDTVPVTPNFSWVSYYYIDDVYVGLDTSSSVSDLRIPVVISVFPNPTKGKFRVEGLEFGVEKIQVYDLFGRLVLRTNKEEIDMSNYPAGIYVVKAGEATLKLILK